MYSKCERSSSGKESSKPVIVEAGHKIDSKKVTVEPLPLVPATVKTLELVLSTFNRLATSLILSRLKSIFVE